VVEHLARHAEVKGSNTATAGGNGRSKMAGNVLLDWSQEEQKATKDTAKREGSIDIYKLIA